MGIRPDLEDLATVGWRIGWKPFAYDRRVASARLRAYIPCNRLERVGLRTSIVPPSGDGSYDCVIFQKAYREEDLVLAGRLATRGVKTVFDLCDNHFYNPDDSPKLAERAARLRRMIDIVDAVTVSSPELIPVVGREPTFVVDDALEAFARRRWPSARDRRTREHGSARQRPVRLVWFGSSGAEKPAFGLVHLKGILGELEELHQVCPLELTVISNSREAFQAHVADAAFPTRYTPWRVGNFPRRFVRNDICVLPIERNPFTICKTNNRVVLSLMLGVPVVTSPLPSYEPLTDWIRFEDWGTNIRSYASDPELARRHIEGARRYIRSVWTDERLVQQWGDVLRTVLQS